MLEIRPSCENCNKPLGPTSTEAMICAFECTFCKDCVEQVLQNVCPNCGGGFEKRPILPAQYRIKYPPSGKVIFKPVDMDSFVPEREKLKVVPPHER